MNDQSILILGSLPPPIGGVTTHIKRLCEYLQDSNIPWKFVDFKKSSKIDILRAIISHRMIHYHSANPAIGFLFSLFCLITFKKLIITFHGDIGYHGYFKNLLKIETVRFSAVPVVLNEKSYEIAKNYNGRTELMAAFIPPKEITDLPSDIEIKISDLNKTCEQLFCTNAFDVSFDTQGREIYQITELVSLFNRYPRKGLIISDPSGNYKKYINKNGIEVRNNILFIPFPHDFNAVINKTDYFIRFTITDGDSLSVKEALLAGKPVIATDVVSRPKGVNLIINDIEDLDRLLNVSPFDLTAGSCRPKNGAVDLVNLYKKISNDNRNQ
jgi:glycosyltransferase involved in cell wall biosynthesis